MNNQIREEIQARINYRFKAPELLTAAFTHSSYVNEHDSVGNERIEFLGDCVLNFLVGEKLYKQDPTASEGALSSRRAALVSRAPLARIVDSLGLLAFLQVGAGVDTNAFSDKARSDLLEAVIGAVYMDGGLESCRDLLDGIFYPNVRPERDYKSELQYYAVDNGFTVEYDTKAVGAEFLTKAIVGDGVFDGTGKSKRASQIAAARCAVEKLIDKK